MKATKQGERESARAVVQQQAQTSAGAADPLRDSPRMVAQRARIDAAFGAVAQKAGALEDEEPLQARRDAAVPQNETGMPNQLKAGIEALSGMDMSDVRVHRNSDKPAQLHALAYAQGNDIHLGPGQEQHLPHEAWHVVQQAQGRVRPTVKMAGAAVNDDVGLEREADVMGARAVVQRVSSGAIQGHIFRAGGTEAIADDLAAHGNLKDEWKDLPDEQVTKQTVEDIALSYGYGANYAKRLADANPFKQSDIDANTTVTGDAVESFDYSHTLPRAPAGLVSRHQLNFENKLESSHRWTMKYNARNPALSTFRAKQVMDVQSEKRYGPLDASVNEQHGSRLDEIVRENIQSVNGKAWFDTNKPPMDAELSPGHLASFLADTDNGRSSKALADDYGKQIKKGFIERYEHTGFSVRMTF